MSSNATPAGHRLITDWFLRALELAPGERAAWLADLDHEHPAEAPAVRQLLDAHVQAGGFMVLADGTAGVEPPPSRAGEAVGPFVIEREIGHGGMGTVYLARRDGAGFSQHVALKLLAPHEGAAAAARLRDERRILAGLNHPNIAHFVDGGTTDDGLPFIAMEYVDGRPIGSHCAQAALDVPGRLRLFLRVCGAVHFAHQHLVVHRDIKPSNILVTSEGTPKLLDFGIAKLLDAGAPGSAAGTVRVLTPHYASPEQVRGDPITTATDIYSLGVLLFELLTSRGPYRGVTPQSDPLSAMEAIRDAAPERPSAVAAMDRALGRDLDAIVLRALRKDPRERYASAEHLAQDLTRYLDGLPVEARRGSTMYRVQRFVGRHRAGVAAGVVAVAALCAAAVVSTRQAQVARDAQARSEARFADVRALANAFVFEFDDAVRDVPGTATARRLVIDRALRYLERLAADGPDDVALDREIAAAYERIADVQGNPYTSNLGDRGAAMTSYRRALELRQRIADSSAATDDDRLHLAAASDGVGVLLWASGDFAGALDQHDRSRQIVSRLAEARPTSEDLAYRAEAASYQVAQSLIKLGRFDEARRHYQSAAAFLASPRLPSPLTPAHQATLAIVAMKLADGSFRGGSAAAALAGYQHSVQTLEALSAAAPGNGGLRRALAFVLHRVALAQAVGGDAAGAESTIRRTLALQGGGNAVPEDRQTDSDIASSTTTLAGITLLAGRANDARAVAADAMRRYDALVAAGADYVDQRSEHAVAVRRAGDAAAAAGDAGAARGLYGRAMALLDESPRDGEYVPERALVYLRASRLATAPSQAAAWRREALAAWDSALAAGVVTWPWEFGGPRALADQMAAARALPGGEPAR